VDLFKVICKSPHSMGYEDLLHRMTILEEARNWRQCISVSRLMEIGSMEWDLQRQLFSSRAMIDVFRSSRMLTAG
jgi:hypothetical protein